MIPKFWSLSRLRVNGSRSWTGSEVSVAKKVVMDFEGPSKACSHRSDNLAGLK